MIISIEKLIKLHYFLLILFSIPTYGQNEIEIKHKIRSSLESFMANLSYVNDEEEPIFPTTIATEFGGGNYFVFNGREMKLEHFIEDYCHSDLQRQIVNHTLVFTHEGIVKLDNDKADKRWSVNAILKREYASNPKLKIDDEEIKFIVSMNDNNEHLSILDIAFHSKPHSKASPSKQTEILPLYITSHKSSRRTIFKDDSYFESKKNNYIAWNILGAGYPWNIVSGIEYRGGGVIGFGIYGDIGLDFTSITYEEYNGHYIWVGGTNTEFVKDTRAFSHVCKTTFRYAGGLKFYPFKGLFVDIGYGTIASTSARVEKMVTGTPYAFVDKNEAEEIREQITVGHGILFHAGYNLVTGDLSKKAGFLFGINGGLSYDVVNKKTSPSINIKFGIAWGR